MLRPCESVETPEAEHLCDTGKAHELNTREIGKAHAAHL